MKKIIYLLLLLLLFRLVISFVLWHPDLNNHMDWGIRFWEYGAKSFYYENIWSFTWPNQPPGTIYMFAGIRKLFEFIFSFFWIINVKIPVFPSVIISFFETNLYPALLKLPAILADFGIAYIIFKWTNKWWASLIFLINPIIWYNSSVWGQYDSVINFFAILSFYLLIKKKLLAATIFLLLSFYIKASLLIFAPIFLIVALRQKYKISKYLYAFIFGLVVIVLLTLPFSSGNPLLWLFNLYKDKVFTQQLHVITANAFNLWSGIAGIHERPDSLPFLGLTYQLWGYILFFISYIPVLYSVAKKQNFKTISWALAVTAFSSFILLTNMHERYLFPLFPYLTILLATNSLGQIIYWLISGIGLLNLYNFWFTPKIDIIVSFLSFGNRTIPRVLGFLLFAIFIKFYYNFLRQLALRKL